jgi:DNA polymerase-3 subunit chi
MSFFLYKQGREDSTNAKGCKRVLCGGHFQDCEEAAFSAILVLSVCVVCVKDVCGNGGVFSSRRCHFGRMAGLAAIALVQEGRGLDRKPKIIFYKVERVEQKEALICLLAKHWVEQGSRIFIHTENEAQETSLDEKLWSAEASSFLPHICGTALPEEESEARAEAAIYPILLHREWVSHLLHDRSVVIASKPVDREDIEHLQRKDLSLFSLIIDFAEVYEEERLTLSRGRFAAWKDAGYTPQMAQEAK